MRTEEDGGVAPPGPARVLINPVYRSDLIWRVDERRHEFHTLLSAGTSLDGESPGFANMEGHSLLAVCFAAMLAVFVLLGLLAVIIRLISVVFPEKLPARSDSTMLAAVATTVASVYPGWRVTRIAEEQ